MQIQSHQAKRRRSMTPKPTIAFFNAVLVFLSLLFVFFLLRQFYPQVSLPSSSSSSAAAIFSSSASVTERRHLFFAVASSESSWPRRKPYVRLWYSPNSTRAVVFLDRNDTDGSETDPSLPETVVSGDTARFPYTFNGGLPSAVRVARVVKEVADRGETGVRWFVFGDDDTMFFVDNLVKTLSKYDHERWFYVGANSESYQQNFRNAFGMAFGGGGFAISASLAKALSRVFDSCLVRYAHLYGSDARVFSCVAELGVGLTYEPGFHQVDVRGNLFGLLSAHPLSPLLSLHHLDAVDPIFPDRNRSESLRHLFEAVNVDPTRILQQLVCYDSSHSLTVSIAWGYAIQVYEGNKLLPELLSVQKTFTQWRRGMNVDATRYMFDTRDFPRAVCKRPSVFFLKSVRANINGVESKYVKSDVGNCPKPKGIKNMETITVYSKKLELSAEEMKAMRRQCCDILPAFNESMVINIHECRVDELISMHS